MSVSHSFIHSFIHSKIGTCKYIYIFGEKEQENKMTSETRQNHIQKDRRKKEDGIGLDLDWIGLDWIVWLISNEFSLSSCLCLLLLLLLLFGIPSAESNRLVSIYLYILPTRCVPVRKHLMSYRRHPTILYHTIPQDEETNKTRHNDTTIQTTDRITSPNTKKMTTNHKKRKKNGGVMTGVAGCFYIVMMMRIVKWGWGWVGWYNCDDADDEWRGWWLCVIDSDSDSDSDCDELQKGTTVGVVLWRVVVPAWLPHTHTVPTPTLFQHPYPHPHPHQDQDQEEGGRDWHTGNTQGILFFFFFPLSQEKKERGDTHTHSNPIIANSRIDQ